MYSSALLGIWPFVFPENPTLQQLYNFYSNSMLVYYVFFIVTAYIKLYYILSADETSIDEVSGNLCITLIYTITIIRQLIMKKDGVRNIIRSILLTEERIYKSKDEKIIAIYDQCSGDTIRWSKMYLGILFVITMLYFIRPIIVPGYYETVNNETLFIRALPLSSWFPFNDQKYYWVSYWWHVLDGCVGASFVTYTDIFTFSLIVYPTGQIKILAHILRNIESYTENIANQLSLEKDVASFVSFRDCIVKHRDIIKYIDDFNENMQYIMVFDFLQSSLQIATILTQVIGKEITLMLVAFVGAFFVGMILRLVLYYYYANEIVELSMDIVSAVWESNWYEQPQKVKYMLLILIMRAQKGMKLLIGPFGVMSLNSFIAILKATYSYIMLMYGLN